MDMDMEEVKAYIAMILCQLICAGNYILCKDVLNGGMPTTIFTFYRLLVGTLTFLPFAFFHGRKNAPNLSWKIAAKIFFLALFGATFILNIYAIGVKYTSPTVTSATSNAIPVVTFILAAILRMESVKLKKVSGIVKVLGVALCLAGVLVLAFYEGPSMKSVNHRPFLHASKNNQGPHSKVEWIIGTFILIFFAIAWSLWMILQGLILKEYPSKFLFSAICTFFGAIQSFVVALITERDFSKWKLRLADHTLLAVLYMGVIVSFLGFYLQVWCIGKKGPVFAAIWQPLSLLITLLCSSFLVGEKIKLGSVVGGLLMVGGLYSVLWGKHGDNLDNKLNTEEEMNCRELPISKNSAKEDHAAVFVGNSVE